MARRIEPTDPASGPRQDRVAAFKLGLSAESRAAMLLIAKGYRIAARRWKTPFGEIAGDQGRRHQVGKFGDENLFRGVADLCGIVDDERPRMDALKHMRRADIGEVERRVLAQQHDVARRQIGRTRLAKGEMIAGDVAHLERLHRR